MMKSAFHTTFLLLSTLVMMTLSMLFLRFAFGELEYSFNGSEKAPIGAGGRVICGAISAFFFTCAMCIDKAYEMLYLNGKDR